MIARFLRDEEGVALAEYAMVLSLFSLGMIVALTALANVIGTDMSNSSNAMTQVQTNPPYTPP